MPARDTVAPIAGNLRILEEVRRDWQFVQVDHGGHMAPLTNPGAFNPIVASVPDELAKTVSGM